MLNKKELIISFHISLDRQKICALEVQQDSYVVGICCEK